jgi:hypothetical protein
VAPRGPAYRRYRRRSMIGAAVYIAATLVATAVIPDHSPPSVLPVALGLLAGAGTVVWIWATARYLSEIEDEYLRMLQVRGMLVATGVTLSITSMWGMVELFTTAPHLPLFLVFPIWCLGLLVGAWSNKRVIGESGEAC